MVRWHQFGAFESIAMSRKPTGFPTAVGTPERFPDFPPRDDMQNPRYLHDHGYLGALRRYYGNSDRILVMGEVPVGWDTSQREGVRIPDLLIAFDVDRAGILKRNGYSIHSEGKPPDFALEIASATTGFADYNQATSLPVLPDTGILEIRPVRWTLP